MPRPAVTPRITRPGYWNAGMHVPVSALGGTSPGLETLWERLLTRHLATDVPGA
jgi:hypothetical protein